MDLRWCSRWKATTTQAISSPIRAPRPASAAFCATSSLWGRGRSLASMHSRSATRNIQRHALWLLVWSPVSAAMAIRSACRRSAVRCASIGAMTAIVWSTPWRSVSPRPKKSFTPRQPASACRSSISARKPAATAFMAPPWPPPNSARMRKRSGRQFRSAIRSRKSFCSKPA